MSGTGGGKRASGGDSPPGPPEKKSKKEEKTTTTLIEPIRIGGVSSTVSHYFWPPHLGLVYNEVYYPSYVVIIFIIMYFTSAGGNGHESDPV